MTKAVRNPLGFGGAAGAVARNTRALYVQRLRNTLAQTKLGLYGGDVVDAAESLLELRRLKRSEVTAEDAVLAANALAAVVQATSIPDALAVRAGTILDNLSRHRSTKS